VINGIEAMASVMDWPRQLVIRSYQPDTDVLGSHRHTAVHAI
jgi:hypothetical protein